MGYNFPNWTNDIEDLKSFIAEAQLRAINEPSTSGTGSGVHIGIFDSEYQLPPEISEPHNVNQGKENSFVNNHDDERISHGISVFNQLSAVAPNAEFSIYEVINEDGKLALGSYADAISKAISDGVDIVNISSGDPWPGPINLNPNVTETKRLIERGITVVAAAGNHLDDGKKPPVHCPAAADGVIAVGSYVTRCPCEPGEESETEPEGPYYFFDSEEKEEITETFTESYCSEQGCVGGMDCITRQSEVAWDGNPLPTGGKPEVLAPMYLIRHHPLDGYYMDGGTSFAAPLVAGSIAATFGELKADGKDIPAPREVQNAVRNGAARLPDSQIGKYDGTATREILNVY
jgi:subtilisin family serine protease